MTELERRLLEELEKLLEDSVKREELLSAQLNELRQQFDRQSVELRKVQSGLLRALKGYGATKGRIYKRIEQVENSQLKLYGLMQRLTGAFNALKE